MLNMLKTTQLSIVYVVHVFTILIPIPILDAFYKRDSQSENTNSRPSDCVLDPDAHPDRNPDHPKM